jgi:hypothetical protein
MLIIDSRVILVKIGKACSSCKNCETFFDKYSCQQSLLDLILELSVFVFETLADNEQKKMIAFLENLTGDCFKCDSSSERVQHRVAEYFQKEIESAGKEQQTNKRKRKGGNIVLVVSN